MPLIKYNNQSLSALTELPASIPTGKLKLISSQTASNSASISFTTGLNSTYKVYKFVFVNIRPATDAVSFQLNFSTDGGTNYNVTKTTTAFKAYANEANTDAVLTYDTSMDLAQGTGIQRLMDLGSDADQNGCGYMLLFNPASTTYVKHFIYNDNASQQSDYTENHFIAGYCNTTSAVNAVRFNMSSGNISAGTIYLYAIDNS